MELALQTHIEELPEGLYLATSDELNGLVAQGRTVAERSISHAMLRRKSLKLGVIEAAI